MEFWEVAKTADFVNPAVAPVLHDSQRNTLVVFTGKKYQVNGESPMEFWKMSRKLVSDQFEVGSHIFCIILGRS